MSSNPSLYGYDLENDPFIGGREGGSRRWGALVIDVLVRWHWVALCIVLGVAIAAYIASKSERRYRATSTIVVKDNSGPIFLGEGVDQGQLDLRKLEGINTIAEGLRRRSHIREVAQDEALRSHPGLVPAPHSWLPDFFGGSEEGGEGAGAQTAAESSGGEAVPVERAADIVSQAVTITSRTGTKLIDISAVHPNPEVAALIANRYAQLFIAENLEQRSTGQKQTFDFLVQESKRVRAELADAQATIAAYGAVTEAEAELERLEAEFGELALRYREKHPRYIDAGRRLATATAKLTRQLREIIQRGVDEEFWSGHKDALGNLESEETVAEARRLFRSRSRLLNNEVGSLTTLFETMVAQIQTREVTNERIEAELEMHEAADVPSLPFEPKPQRIVIYGLFLGVASGLGLALLFTRLDNRIHTVAQMEAEFDLPVLGCISSLDEKAAGARGTGGHKEAPLDPWHAKWSPEIIFRSRTPRSHHAEMFRSLRTSIELLGPADERKVTVITSAIPAEGKTLISCNLAVSKARMGQRILLIDFDLRRPSIHEKFGISRKRLPGIVDVLTGKADLREAVTLLPSEASDLDLHVLFSGSRAPNPGELLDPAAISRVLDVVRPHFTHVILDTAPLLAVPDSRILARFADNLCLVVKADHTPKGAVRRAIDLLGENEVRPSGTVLNGYTERKLLIGRNYSYGYYRYGGSYYGSYGSVYGDEEEEEGRDEPQEDGPEPQYTVASVTSPRARGRPAPARRVR